MKKQSYYFMRFPGGKPKAITLSYDDGVAEDIRFIDLMKQYGFKGTFNLSYNRIPEDKVLPPGKRHRKLTAEEIREVYTPDCTEIAMHSFNHTSFGSVTPAEVMYEITEDRKGWESFLGTVVRGFAYANGSFNDEAVEVLRMAGVTYARTTKQTENFDLPTDWLRLKSTCKHTDPRLMQLANELAELEVMKEPKWFYLWGHTYEFEDADNWCVIEDFFRRMSGLQDVWYATNTEIYDYLQAYQELQYSADGEWVHNPTTTDVWLGKTDSDETLCIPAGKTIKVDRFVEK